MPRTTGASVAERELKAALGALGARRMRKEAGEPDPLALAPLPPVPSSPRTLHTPPTFAPAAVSSDTHRQWNEFIAANHSQRLQISYIYVTFLALINCLQRYEYSDISVSIQPFYERRPLRVPMGCTYNMPFVLEVA